MSSAGAIWRAEIEAVEFHIDGRYRFVVHRNVFRTLRGAVTAPADCVTFVEDHADIFYAAARTRLGEATSPVVLAFHLNSRHLRRAFATAEGASGIFREPGPR